MTRREFWIVGGIGIGLVLAVGVWFWSHRTSGDAISNPNTQTLVGSDWILESLNGAPTLRGANITLSVEPNRVRGYAGCNWYGSKGSLQNGSILWNETTLTLRLCTQPQGVIEQEIAYMKALQNMTSYVLVGDRLTMTRLVPPEFLTFARRPIAAVQPAQLVHSQWELVALNNVPPLAGSKITLAFDGNGFQGAAGCRDYIGRYQAEGDHIQISFIEMQDTDCFKPEAFLLQEGNYTTLLSESRFYNINEQILELTTEAGKVLRFQRARNSP